MMNVNPGGVDTCLSVIEAFEKDPGFKKALEELKGAHGEKKLTDAQVAKQQAELEKAGKTAHDKQLAAVATLEKLASTEESLAQREGELEGARKALNETMRKKQGELDAALKRQKLESERLQSFDGQLKQLQGELQQKEFDLKKDREEFDAWRSKLRSLVA